MNVALLNQQEQDELAQSRLEALEKAGRVFDRLDVNGDGEIERAEVSSLARQGLGGLARLSQFDEQTREAKVDEFIKSFDSNGDGKIQRSEWLAFYGNLFDQAIGAGFSKANQDHNLNLPSQYKGDNTVQALNKQLSQKEELKKLDSLHQQDQH